MRLKKSSGEYQDNRKKIIFQMGALFLLIILCVIGMIVSVIRVSKIMKEELQNTEYEMETIYTQNDHTVSSESETEVVPNFGTVLSNMERFAVPLLEDKSYLLEKALTDFLPELKGGEIFYVLIPEDNKDIVDFFVRSEELEEIVVLSFSWSTGLVEVSWSEYNEQEVLSEAWNGNLPECRDEEE